jgi:membrane carboxypeptidase/penicillin-binding protein
MVCGVWVGFDQKKTIGPGMTGARAALPIWTDFMIGATRGRPAEDFPMPLGTINRQVCAETGMLATDACPDVTTEMFAEGSEPTEYCSAHPGHPLLAPGSAAAPAPPEAVRPDLRQLDRSARERDRDRSTIH